MGHDTTIASSVTADGLGAALDLAPAHPRPRRPSRQSRRRPHAASSYPVETWDAARVRSLRAHLQWTQEEMAQRFHVRQQTISEWETGKYTPRGRSLVVLTALARRYRFPADPSPELSPTEPATALVLGVGAPDAPSGADAP